MGAMQRFPFDYRGRAFALEIDGRDLVLYLNGVERKRRSRDGVECVYVWTNVELEWEEHHFIEARWWPGRGRLVVTSNGAPLLDVEVAP
jgi:hypothetical protein